MKQFSSYNIYTLDLTRVFCSVTGFQFAYMPKILYLCKIKRRDYISYYFTFMKFCIYIYIYIYIYIHRKNKAVIEIHESEIIGYVVPSYPNTYIFAIFFIL